MKYNQ